MSARKDLREKLATYFSAMGPKISLSKWDDRVETRACIDVDATRAGHEITPLIYSHFIEQIGKCIEGGLWTPGPVRDDYFLGGIRPDVLEAVKAVKPAGIRWPGGCFADSYRWRDGIGPRGERKSLPNVVWRRAGKRIGPDVTNQFGTDEFLLFCEEVGAEPMPTANLGTALPEEAGDWVEYCNGGTETRWGGERARNGREAPYATRYWFLGNEMWNAFEPGWCTAREYARRFVAAAREMRKRDPALKLIAVGLPQGNNDWNRTVLEEAGAELDYLSIHAYHPHLICIYGLGEAYRRWGFYGVLLGVHFFEEVLDNSWEAVEQWAPEGRDIKLTFDEWNLWYLLWDTIRTNYNLRDGLFCAGVLNALMRRADRVPIANLAQLVNTLGIVYVDERGSFLTPSGWVFNMYAESAGESNLELRAECDSVTTSKAKLPVLNAAASADVERKTMRLYVVNNHRSEEIQAQVTTAGFVPRAEAHVSELTHHDPMRYNTPLEPQAVVPRSRSISLAVEGEGGGGSFAYGFPPHSVTVLTLRGTQGDS